MFKTIHEATETLMARKNLKYGTDGLIKALQEVGNPHLKLKVIHIAGTNGKGSTTNYVRAILQTAGYKVATFTSPHLVKHNDRIRINDQEISDDALLDIINTTYDLWMKHGLSMFEIDMLISALYFVEHAVDYVVYEVGLGGRLDATNVVVPCVSAITNIGMDHQAILGDTIAKIAGEKAGIIKKDVPLITTVDDPEALQVILDTCLRVGAPFHQVCVPDYTLIGDTLNFEYGFEPFVLKNQATYQVNNATLAIALIQKIQPDITHDTIQKGLLSTHWAGRFEQVIPHVYIDGAHNEMGIQKLVESLSMVARPWTILFTALADKDHDVMISMLEHVADTLIVTQFDFYRAQSAENLALNHQAIVIKDAIEAINYGLETKGDGTFIITGSLYFISQARAYLMNSKE